MAKAGWQKLELAFTETAAIRRQMQLGKSGREGLVFPSGETAAIRGTLCMGETGSAGLAMSLVQPGAIRGPLPAKIVERLAPEFLLEEAAATRRAIFLGEPERR